MRRTSWPKPFTDQFAIGCAYAIGRSDNTSAVAVLKQALTLIDFLLAEGNGTEDWWSYGKQLVDIGAEAGIVEPFLPEKAEALQ